MTRGSQRLEHGDRAVADIAVVNAMHEILYRMRCGFRRAIAGMAVGGYDIVVDHGSAKPWRPTGRPEGFASFVVVYVGVHCSGLNSNTERSAQGDQPIGLAALQLRVVHAQDVHDVERDTTTTSHTTAPARLAAPYNIASHAHCFRTITGCPEAVANEPTP